MDAGNRCPICKAPTSLKFRENIESHQFKSTTYGSRKRPELMHYALHECRDCHLLYVANGPTSPDLEQLYFDSDFDSPQEAKHASQTYLREVQRRALDCSSVLDVGAGEGSFLQLCIQNGSEFVQGYEPSRAARNQSAGSVREAIIPGTFEGKEPSPVFSLVTLFQTIEHLKSPEEFLDFAQNSLRDGGTVAIACHDYRHPLNLILGRASPIFDIEHLQLFSRRSIYRLLSRAGFQNISVRRYWNRYPIAYLIKLSPLGDVFSPVWKNPKSFLYRLSFPVMLGNLFVTATK